MLFWVKNIRLLIYTGCFVAALLVPIYFQFGLYAVSRAYAVLAFICLYLALLASPLGIVFPNFIWRVVYSKARKALGISAFFFAAMHASLGFFGLLGGFSGIWKENPKIVAAIFFGFSALFILIIMAITSIQYFHKKLGSYWKRIHRFVYLAGFFAVLYAYLIDPNFSDIKKPLTQISLALLIVLISLEAIRFYLYQKSLRPRAK